jgi:prevent-host-death family protein
MQVALREFKAGLSGYLARAQQGEVIEVTSHKRPVARILGLPSQAAPGVQRLLATQAASWSGHKPALLAPLVLSPGGNSLSALVLEDRA